MLCKRCQQENISYGRAEIPEQEGWVCQFGDTDSKETLDAIWDKYCSYNAFELVEMTQKQEPRKLAYSRRETMKNSDIKKYFQSTY